MRLQKMALILALLCLVNGCQQQSADFSSLESAGATISKGLDGNVTSIRFLTAKISPACAESMKGITGLKKIHGSGKDLGDAEISGLAAIPTLTGLSLPEASVGSEAVAAIAASKTLGTIDLSGSSMTDELLDGMKGQAAIRILNLSQTSLTDQGTDTIATMSNLEELSLIDTGITAAGIGKLADALPNLRLLAVGSESLSDDAVAAAANFKSLETLELVNSSITGATLESLAGIPTLTRIDLQGSPDLTNENILVLGQLVALENLNVERSQFSSQGLNENGFKKLSTLTANGTKVTDAEISNFTGLPVLYSVKVLDTPVTEEGVRKHFAPTSQTTFEWSTP